LNYHANYVAGRQIIAQFAHLDCAMPLAKSIESTTGLWLRDQTWKVRILSEDQHINYTALTVELVASYVANNSVRADDLAGLIASTHSALAALDRPSQNTETVPAEQEHTAAVTQRKSLSNPDHILSMIDGKPYKSLKRHLSSRGLTPDQYRQRYNLPTSYPMVASGYSEQRREVAKRLGLGRKPRAEGAVPKPETEGAAKPGRKPRAKAGA